MSRWFFSIVLLLSPSFASAQRPPAVTPASADTVLERLPKGYASLVPQPAGGTTTKQDIQRLLTTAARTGDARLATRTEALLARFPLDTRDTEIIKARAFSAQHRHDFTGALRLLDEAIKINPRDVGARFSRAQIQLVQGRINRARADCAALALGVDSSEGLICLGALSLRTGNLQQSMAMADRWLAQDKTNSGVRRYVLVMRAEAASRAGAPDADQWFREALALDPQDVRTLSAYARHLYDNNRSREVIALLARAPQTDGLTLQMALAAHATKSPQAPALIRSQARRYATAHAVGVDPELRDEAEYLLTLKGDAAGALKLAQRNFETQRDHEDVALLRRAALAAGRPDALKPLDAWAASQQLRLAPLDEVRR